MQVLFTGSAPKQTIIYTRQGTKKSNSAYLRRQNDVDKLHITIRKKH